MRRNGGHKPVVTGPSVAARWMVIAGVVALGIAGAGCSSSESASTTTSASSSVTEVSATTAGSGGSTTAEGSGSLGVVSLSQELVPSECTYQRRAAGDGNDDVGYIPTVAMPDGSIRNLLTRREWVDIWRTCFVEAGVMPDEEMALFIASTVFQFSYGYVVRPGDVDKLATYFEREGFDYAEPTVEFSDDGFVASFYFFDEPIQTLSWLEMQVSPDFVGYINQDVDQNDG